jgi:hypothetical protein
MTLDRLLGVFAAGWLVALGSFAGEASAATAPVSLGTAGGFAVLAGSTVTSAGASTLTGDLGVSPGTAWFGGADHRGSRRCHAHPRRLRRLRVRRDDHVGRHAHPLMPGAIATPCSFSKPALRLAQPLAAA